jgi:hypothetical protein
MFINKKQFGRGNCSYIGSAAKCERKGCCWRKPNCFDCEQLNAGLSMGDILAPVKKTGDVALQDINKRLEKGEELTLREQLEHKHQKLQHEIKFDVSRKTERYGVSYNDFEKEMLNTKRIGVDMISNPEDKKELILNLLQLIWEGTTVDKASLSPNMDQIKVLYDHLDNEFKYNFNIEPKAWVEFIWKNNEDWLFWKDRWSAEPWSKQKTDLERRAKILCREVVLSKRRLCTFDGHGRFIYLFYKCFYFCDNLFDTTVDPNTQLEVLPTFNLKFAERSNYVAPHIDVYTLNKGPEYIWHVWFFPKTVTNKSVNIFEDLWDRHNDQLKCEIVDKYVVYLNFCGMDESYLTLTKLIATFKNYNQIKKKKRYYSDPRILLCAGNIQNTTKEQATYGLILDNRYKYSCHVHNPIIYVSYMTGSEEWRPMVKQQANNNFRTCVTLPLLEECQLVSKREDFDTRKIVGELPQDEDTNEERPAQIKTMRKTKRRGY